MILIVICSYSIGLMMINGGKTMSKTTHDWEWFIAPIYGDDWGMVYYWFNHINVYLNI